MSDETKADGWHHDAALDQWRLWRDGRVVGEMNDEKAALMGRDTPPT